jgi:phospholipid transport system substrate-binding protein
LDSKDSMAFIEASRCPGGVPQARGIDKGLSMWLRCGASLVIVIVFAAAPSRAAQDTQAPLAKVKTTLGKALAILRDQQMPVEQRRRALQHLAERNLDLERMARGSLGDHWNEMTPAGRDEFVSLFGAFIEAAYLAQIQDYVELNIDVSKERVASQDYAQVDATVIQPHEETLPITFMLERHADDWIVYDVVVEGVSMVANYRAQFDRVIKRQGLAQLLSELRAKQRQLTDLIGKP